VLRRRRGRRVVRVRDAILGFGGRGVGIVRSLCCGSLDSIRVVCLFVCLGFVCFYVCMFVVVTNRGWRYLGLPKV